MSQDATCRFSSARGGKIDLFGIDLSADAINHEPYKQELRLIVNKVANDLQCNLHIPGKPNYFDFEIRGLDGVWEEFLQHDVG